MQQVAFMHPILRNKCNELHLFRLWVYSNFFVKLVRMLACIQKKRKEINTQYNDLMNEFQYLNQDLLWKLVLNLLAPYRADDFHLSQYLGHHPVMILKLSCITDQRRIAQQLQLMRALLYFVRTAATVRLLKGICFATFLPTKCTPSFLTVLLV